MADWIAHWNVLTHRYQQLEDTMARTQAVLTDPEASAMQRAQALIMASSELCAVLRDYARRGVFTDIAEAAQGATAAQRQMVLTDLARVLTIESTVLQRVGLDAALIKDILSELDRTLAGTQHHTPLDAAAWEHRLTRATQQICDFPKAEILALDNDFGRWVRRVAKTKTLLRAIFTGAANIAVASQLPEPATIKSVSTFLAFVAASVLSDPG